MTSNLYQVLEAVNKTGLYEGVGALLVVFTACCVFGGIVALLITRHGTAKDEVSIPSRSFREVSSNLRATGKNKDAR